MKKIIFVLFSVFIFVGCLPPQRILGFSQMMTLGTDSLMLDVADKDPNTLFLRMKDTLTDNRVRHFVVSIRNMKADTVVKNEVITRSTMAVEDTHYIDLANIESGTYSATLHQFYGDGKSSWEIPLKTIVFIRE
jgi:hypothetical protein